MTGYVETRFAEISGKLRRRTEIADFTPDELSELIERMQREGRDAPLTKEEFKKKYFEYYDDVKDKSLKRQDW